MAPPSSSVSWSSVLVLASASPRRRELLGHLRVPFRVEPSDVEETLPDAVGPAAVEEVARRKARAVAARLEAGVVLGADTVVVLAGEALGKPASPDEARTTLRRLRGRAHEVLTGVAVVEAATGRTAAGTARTLVLMADYTDAEIEAYVASGEPLDKAGAYGIQDRQGALVAGWVGPYSNVMGLPLALTRRLLAAVGIRTGEVSADPAPPGGSPPEGGSSAPGTGDDGRG